MGILLMEKLGNEKYLLSRLNSGDLLKFVVLSHNAYWSDFQTLKDHYNNLDFILFGGSYYDLEMYRVGAEQLKDYDFVLFFSSNQYDENEMLKLKRLVIDISNSGDKRVTFGYSYVLSNEKRTKDVMDEVLLFSVKKEDAYFDIHTCSYTTNWNIRDLAGLTLKFHELSKKKERQDIKQKKKKYN